jgi:hypothetical protein
MASHRFQSELDNNIRYFVNTRLTWYIWIDSRISYSQHNSIYGGKIAWRILDPQSLEIRQEAQELVDRLWKMRAFI